MSPLVTVLLSVFLVLALLRLVHFLFYWKWKNVKHSFRASTIENWKLCFLQKNLASLCNELYCATKEKYVGFFVLGKPSILIKDLTIIKRILVNDFDNFTDRTVAANYKSDPLGARTLFVEKNPVWKFVRSRIASSFSTGKMIDVFPQMARAADNFVEYLGTNEAKLIDMSESCPRYSTDVVTSCAFGVEENSFKNDKSLSREASRRIFPFNVLRGLQFAFHFISPFLTKLLNMKWLDSSASHFVTNMFNDIKEQRSKEGGKDDYVGRLIKLEKQNVFHSDPQEYLAQAASFFLAGFETVGSTLMFSLYELANNKEMQSKLRKSINTHIQSTDNELTYKSMMDVEYLMNIVNETLRKYSVLPFLDRKTKANYHIPEDYLTIDAGTNVYISLQGIHYDPAYFPNPTKFDPDRFSSENKHKMVPNSYLPFGDGPRSCIGARFGKLSVSVALTKIIQNFEVSLADQGEEIDFDQRGFLLAPTKKIHLIFHKI